MNNTQSYRERAQQMVKSGEAADFRAACSILSKRSAAARRAKAARRQRVSANRPHWQDR